MPAGISNGEVCIVRAVARLFERGRGACAIRTDVANAYGSTSVTGRRRRRGTQIKNSSRSQGMPE